MENFRCFRKPQSARLAPLTLLVGENSTGKTSFLALVRALWKVAFQDEVPDFREEPYDLGTFGDVVHNRGGRRQRPESFMAGFGYNDSRYAAAHDIEGMSFEVGFENRRAFPFPVRRRLAMRGDRVELEDQGLGQHLVAFGAAEGRWEAIVQDSFGPHNESRVESVAFLLMDAFGFVKNEHGVDLLDFELSDVPYRDVLKRIQEAFFHARSPFGKVQWPDSRQMIFASAPVRSRPQRTYDPTPQRIDPEGNHVPMLLASTYQNAKERWELLKGNLEIFGRESGLFDEISIKSLGNTEGSPFQIQIRKFRDSTKRRQVKGPHRNLIDVGYGVSQALPVLTELLDLEPAPLFLLQQPEVHLHPRAQAALGTLFCFAAAPNRQLIVETHSDYLLDRVRMDVRDKRTDLKPEDVSILYFERDGLEVNIHSLRLDEMGNVLDAPPGYGQFFMDEMRRSINL